MVSDNDADAFRVQMQNRNRHKWLHHFEEPRDPGARDSSQSRPPKRRLEGIDPISWNPIKHQSHFNIHGVFAQETFAQDQNGHDPWDLRQGHDEVQAVPCSGEWWIIFFITVRSTVD
jgi:hypothetical protein